MDSPAKYIRSFSKLNDRNKYILNQSVDTNEKPIYEELFDIINNPKEQHNLVGNADYKMVLDEYRQKCKILMSELN